MIDLRTVKRQPTAHLRLAAANDAVTSLRYALAAAKQAGAARTAERIRRALRSAEGAVRHAGGMAIRAAEIADARHGEPGTICGVRGPVPKHAGEITCRLCRHMIVEESVAS